MRIPIERSMLAAIVAALAGLVAWPAAHAVLGAAGGAILSLLLALGAGTIAWRRLPPGVDGAARRRPALAAAWTVLALVAVVQTARLGDFLLDPASDWWVTTKQEFFSKHACMTAYIYAADLNRQGHPNVYDPALYPGLNPEAEIVTDVENLSPEDPYQYPPQFLLLPRLALALSDDFAKIRPVWYTVQAVFFFLVAIALARWYGGSAGRAALWLLPALWVSVPSALNFQYGQFHVSTIALAMAAFLAFEKRRDGLGGSLLSASILAKGFPAILVVPMLLHRRWRAAAWTGAWAAGWTVLAWFVLGPEPFEAFLGSHLERVRSGAAFAFEEAWPDFRSLLLAGNVSPFSLVRKLGELGIAGATDGLAQRVHELVSIAFLGLAALAAKVRAPRARALTWLALLNLAAMTSPAAWGDYVPFGTLWLVTLLVGDRGKVPAGALALVGGFCFLLPGVVPIGNFPGPLLALVLSIAGTALLLVGNGWFVVREARLGITTEAATRATDRDRRLDAPRTAARAEA